MIGHQTEGVDIKCPSLHQFSDNRTKVATVFIIRKHGGLLYAASHNMVVCTLKFNPTRSTHPPIPTGTRLLSIKMKIENTVRATVADHRMTYATEGYINAKRRASIITLDVIHDTRYYMKS